jgi:hypothetical protein
MPAESLKRMLRRSEQDYQFHFQRLLALANMSMMLYFKSPVQPLPPSTFLPH